MFDLLASTYWHIPEWGNLTLIEAIWLLSGIVTILACVRHLPTLYADWRLARKLTQGDGSKKYLEVVSFSYVRREAVRLLQGSLIVGLGIYAWLQPPPPNGATIVTPVGLMVTAVIVLIGASAAVQSWWDQHTRVQILAILETTSEELIKERANDSDQRIQEKRRQAM